MSVMSKGRRGRLVVSAAVIAAAAGAIVPSAAATASAAVVKGGPGCTVSSGYETTPSPNRIAGYDYITCEDRTAPETVNILKLVNGTWTTVAFGEGLVTYTCNGNAENNYEVITTKTQTFEDSCG